MIPIARAKVEAKSESLRMTFGEVYSRRIFFLTKFHATKIDLE